MQALTIDHPLTRVFVLMCMLHPDKPSNLSGPWLTNVAKMITGIYATITRTTSFSGKLRKCHALHQFRIFPKVTGRYVDKKFTYWGAFINFRGLTQLYPTKGANHPTIQLRANHEKRRRKITPQPYNLRRHTVKGNLFGKVLHTKISV